MLAYALVKLSRGPGCSEVLPKIRNTEHVREACHIIGPYDIMAEVEAPNKEDIENVLSSISKYPKVIDIFPMYAINVIPSL